MGDLYERKRRAVLLGSAAARRTRRPRPLRDHGLRHRSGHRGGALRTRRAGGRRPGRVQGGRAGGCGRGAAASRCAGPLGAGRRGARGAARGIDSPWSPGGRRARLPNDQGRVECRRACVGCSRKARSTPSRSPVRPPSSTSSTWWGATAAVLLRDVVVASIGPITAETAARQGIVSHVVPESYTIPALADALVRHFQAARPTSGPE